MEDFVNVIELFRKTIRFFLNYKKLFIVSIALGIITGIGFTLSIRPQFKSNLVGLSSILNTEDIYPILNKVKTLLKDENYDELTMHIPLPLNDIRNLINIEVTSEILATKKIDNQEQIKNKFNIEVTVTDYRLFDSLNIYIPTYIRNNKYTKLKNELVSYRKQKMYEKLEEEIAMLDSVKYVIVSGMTGSKNGNSIYLNNPSLINESIIKLYEQKLLVYENLRLNQDFQVIEGFVTVKHPFNKKYVRNSGIGAVTFFAIAFLIALALEARKIL